MISSHAIHFATSSRTQKPAVAAAAAHDVVRRGDDIQISYQQLGKLCAFDDFVQVMDGALQSEDRARILMSIQLYANLIDPSDLD